MKRRLPHAFTLIEMVTVVAVIIVLAGMVISVSGYVQNKGAREKTTAQLKNLQLQCEAYKVDNGTYPRDDKATPCPSDVLDPRIHFSPVSGSSAPLYINSCRYLYSALSGDFEPAAAPDGQAEEHVYYAFKRDELNFAKNGDGSIKTVRFIQDPFGNCYGYSTAAATQEAEYRKKLRENPTEPRPSQQQGYNPTYDLWSTAGGTSQTATGKWIKSWGS